MQPISYNTVTTQHFLFKSSFYVLKHPIFSPLGQCRQEFQILSFSSNLFVLFSWSQGVRHLKTVFLRLPCKMEVSWIWPVRDICDKLEVGRRETFRCFQLKQVQYLELWVPESSEVPAMAAGLAATSSFVAVPLAQWPGKGHGLCPGREEPF